MAGTVIAGCAASLRSRSAKAGRRRKAEAVPVSVNYDIDIVGIVECQRRPRKGGVVEMPVRRIASR